jgi:hypothetical protein
MQALGFEQPGITPVSRRTREEVSLQGRQIEATDMVTVGISMRSFLDLKLELTPQYSKR